MRLWLSADHERVLVQVWDADHQLPVPRRPDPDAEHGRGLLLVESLGEAWGAYRPQRSIGKVAWAILH